MTRTKISHMQIAGKEKQKGNQSSTDYGCTPRISRARQRVVATKPHVDLERAQIRTESFMKTEGEPFVIRTSKAFLEHCQRRTLLIQEDELIVGTEGSVIRAGVFNPEAAWQWLSNELDTVSSRPFDPYDITDEQKTLVRELLQPYWKGKSLEETWEARASEEMKHLDFGVVTRSAHVADVGACEYTADHGWLIEVGTKGIRKTIEHRLATLALTIPGDYDRITYLKALLIACDGIDTIARRYARQVKKMAEKETDRKRKEELETIARVCQRVPKEPARTFHEALQALWFYQMALRMEAVGGTQNPGRMDQYLYPYYKKDLEEDRITREKAQELLECLWVKFGELILAFSERIATYAAGYSPFITASCGGVTDRGQDAVNDLSYMMVQAAIDVLIPFCVSFQSLQHSAPGIRRYTTTK